MSIVVQNPQLDEDYSALLNLSTQIAFLPLRKAKKLQDQREDLTRTINKISVGEDLLQEYFQRHGLPTYAFPDGTASSSPSVPSTDRLTISESVDIQALQVYQKTLHARARRQAERFYKLQLKLSCRSGQAIQVGAASLTNNSSKDPVQSSLSPTLPYSPLLPLSSSPGAASVPVANEGTSRGTSSKQATGGTTSSPPVTGGANIQSLRPHLLLGNQAVAVNPSSLDPSISLSNDPQPSEATPTPSLTRQPLLWVTKSATRSAQPPPHFPPCAIPPCNNEMPINLASMESVSDTFGANSRQDRSRSGAWMTIAGKTTSAPLKDGTSQCSKPPKPNVTNARHGQGQSIIRQHRRPRVETCPPELKASANHRNASVRSTRLYQRSSLVSSQLSSQPCWEYCSGRACAGGIDDVIPREGQPVTETYYNASMRRPTEAPSLRIPHQTLSETGMSTSRQLQKTHTMHRPQSPLGRETRFAPDVGLVTEEPQSLQREGFRTRVPTTHGPDTSHFLYRHPNDSNVPSGVPRTKPRISFQVPSLPDLPTPRLPRIPIHRSPKVVYARRNPLYPQYDPVIFPAPELISRKPVDHSPFRQRQYFRFSSPLPTPIRPETSLGCFQMAKKAVAETKKLKTDAEIATKISGNLLPIKVDWPVCSLKQEFVEWSAIVQDIRKWMQGPGWILFKTLLSLLVAFLNFVVILLGLLFELVGRGVRSLMME